MTLDGKIATRTGSSRWISGPAARAQVGLLRSRCDGIMVGVDTVLADDPSLTARAADDSLLPRQPLRIVLDSRGRLRASARIVNGSLPGKTFIATTPAGRDELNGLDGEGVEVWAGESTPDGRVHLPGLFEELGRRRLISVLVESGGKLLASLLEARLVDEVVAFIAPKLVGGRDAPTPVAGTGIADMASAVELIDVTYERVGRDILVKGYPRACSPRSK
jgi:diaminohydroxyphosphoribosylaminopyrimidine deaminase/5-amino-6-(5-phosphoribosylamino)uracil reductase